MKDQMNYESNIQLTHLIKELADEYAEKYDEQSLSLSELKHALQQKEFLLEEMKIASTNNYDLFSPNYGNTNNDIMSLKAEINELKLKQEQYHKELEVNKNRNMQLLKVLQNLNYLESENELYHNGDQLEVNQNKAKKGLELLDTQERERQRIARDLHDSTVQNLTGLVHKAELCKKLIDIDAIRAKLELAAMSNTIKSLINELRYIIYNLKPMSLDDLGLTLTIERYAKHIMEANDIPIVIKKNEEPKGILPVINLTIFRVVQEACSNIIKHAKAENIEININYKKNRVIVSVIDDGIGFNYNNVQRKEREPESGFGLPIMRERVSLLSGTLEIKSEIGKGTIVTVSVPLTKFEGDTNE